MESPDTDRYFGEVLRAAAKGTRLSRAQALKTYFLFLELRHKVEIHQMTGRVVECPIDEINRPRGRQQAKLRIPPTAGQVDHLFAGWREELATCRKFAPTARNYTACRLMSEVGLRVNEVCKLDLADVKWDLGRFGKLHIRHGKGARGSGPRERMVPLINNGARRCGSSSRTGGVTSVTTTLGPASRGCHPSGRTATRRRPGSVTRPYGQPWPGLPVRSRHRPGPASRRCSSARMAAAGRRAECGRHRSDPTRPRRTTAASGPVVDQRDHPFPGPGTTSALAMTDVQLAESAQVPLDVGQVEFAHLVDPQPDLGHQPAGGVV